MTTDREDGYAAQAKRVGAHLAEGKVLNPYRVWKLEPRERTPEPNRKTLT